MNPEIQKAVEAGKLTPAAAAALEKISPGTFVSHKSWGFGQVDSVNFLLSQISIHFSTKRSHPMQLQYACESLTVIPPEHILAQRASNLAGVKERAKSDPVALTRQILQSFGGKASLDQMSQALVPEVLSEPEFKRWIDSTKKALKKDGHFVIPAKKSDLFEIRETAISHADEHLAAFSQARQLKEQVAALEVILKNVSEFSEPAAQLQNVIDTAGDVARKGQKLQPAQALSMLISRDEIIENTQGLNVGADAPTVAAFLQACDRSQLATLLDEIPAAKLRRAISSLPAAFGDQWTTRAIDLALRGSTRLVSEAARFLIEKGLATELRDALSKAISEYSISDKTLHWLARDRSGHFTDLAGVRLLGAIISALERQQFSEKRDRKLHDLLLGDKDLLNDLIEEATPEEMREIMRRILLATAFEELNKRSLLGRIIRVYPELQSMVSGDSGETEESLVVSWPSLEKRKTEYEELVSKRIPENVKEISVARSYGDLRENFEYKAAKEMQRVLMRRKSEMERELSRARGTDFANPDLSRAAIGTKATIRNSNNGLEESYHILGAWDGDPARNIISYQTAIAQALIGKQVGDEVTIPAENGESSATIVSIEASDSLPAPVAALSH
jgi:transcription elongation GreA/GreB family factor